MKHNNIDIFKLQKNIFYVDRYNSKYYVGTYNTTYGIGRYSLQMHKNASYLIIQIVNK